MWTLITATGILIAPAFAQQATGGDVVSMEAVGGPPEYYVVQSGDTLWDISSRFLGDAQYWPRLWSINDQITNPHWIYPGNRIRFTMGTLLEPPDIGLEGGSRDGYTVAGLDYSPTDTACGPDVHFETTMPVTDYQSLGFLAEEDDLDVFGKVARARPSKVHLSEGDLLYLDVESPDAFLCGDIVTIFRPIKKKIRHPERRGVAYGTLYRVVGEAKVVHRYGDYLSAVVRTSYSEIARGDLVGPSVPLSVALEVHKPDGDVTGTIIARLNDDQMTLAATGETVFLDKGRADGLRVGNSFYIIDQRDELLNVKGEDEDLPPSVVGRVVVVRVDDYASTAVVTDASRSVGVGANLSQVVE